MPLLFDDPSSAAGALGAADRLLSRHSFAKIVAIALFVLVVWLLVRDDHSAVTTTLQAQAKDGATLRVDMATHATETRDAMVAVARQLQELVRLSEQECLHGAHTAAERRACEVQR